MKRGDRLEGMMEEDLRKEMEELRRRKKEEPEQPEEEAAETRTYVVQPGDSLSKIAKEVYGDAGRWREIFEANQDQIEEPNLIRPGWELRIP